MTGQLAGQPTFFLREGSQRTKGKEEQHNNIMAAGGMPTGGMGGM